MNRVVVLGSLNTDIVITTNRLPEIGETIIGENINYMIGGKGANQAVAASRFGGEVTMLGKLGDDTFGQKVLKHLAEENLDLTYLDVEKNMFTGIASIFKLPTDNCITVVPGANELVSEDYIDSAASIIEESQVLLTQLEIPVKSVKKGLILAKEKGVKTILNPAPFVPEVVELIQWVDYITPNETEFMSICGQKFADDSELEQAMVSWSQAHKETQLIVTRGELGTSFVHSGEVVTVKSIAVEVVDTTGAGDTFNGILAVELSKGTQLDLAIKKAGIGASLSVQKLGAQTGMPSETEINQRMNQK